MNINAAYYSSVGNRARNEDNILLLETGSNVVAIAADGLGGELDGEIASRIAIQTISGQLSAGVPEERTEKTIEAAVSKANEEILKHQSSGQKMKSTVAVLYIDNTCACAVSVGDTRIYQFRKNKLVYQSTDHSVSQMAVSVGAIHPGEIRGHADRNKLTRALGSAVNAEVDSTVLFHQSGDCFLLCSDGFWEYVLEDEMCEDLRCSGDADEWLRKMRDRVEKRISKTGDNHSAIAIIIM